MICDELECQPAQTVVTTAASISVISKTGNVCLPVPGDLWERLQAPPDLVPVWGGPSRRSLL